MVPDVGLNVLTVAVVIPCFNGAKFLADALESVNAQTRAPQRIIVVDDGSTDSSSDIAREHGAVVLRQDNRGDGAARNAGIAAADTDLVAWLDADDRWRPNHLATVAGLLDVEPSAVAAFGAVQRFGSRTELIRGYVRPGPPVWAMDEAFNDWLHTTISAVVRTQGLRDIGGFDEDERSAVDFDLWLRLSREHRFVATHEVTADWRMHPEQQSSTPWKQVAAVYRYRRRFLCDLYALGDPRVRRLEHAFNRIWARDCIERCRSADSLTLRALAFSAPLVAPWRGLRSP